MYMGVISVLIAATVRILSALLTSDTQSPWVLFILAGMFLGLISMAKCFIKRNWYT